MRILITGNAGFIGSRTWDRLAGRGHELYGIDDLSRRTSVRNYHANSIIADIVDIQRIDELRGDFDWVIHLAGQVSVVGGESDPMRDFHSNAVGTFEILQWAKQRGSNVIYSSTNKVFGELKNISEPIIDTFPIAPQTNYGVSKAAGALYVGDYEGGWVLHQSCIYGPTQKGEVDQGWIGWLRRQIEAGQPITCFGDGTQVRDLLHVDDLIDLYELIIDGGIEHGSYVVGGGESNSLSFSEAVKRLGGQIALFDEWRPHDQRYFISANSGVQTAGWSPRIDISSGLNF